MTRIQSRTIAAQKAVDAALGIPDHFCGFGSVDALFIPGCRKVASHLIGWLAARGGPGVVAFPLARARAPAFYRDGATRRCFRWKPHGSKAAAVVVLRTRERESKIPAPVLRQSDLFHQGAA
jgi:hypothetical protein